MITRRPPSAGRWVDLFHVVIESDPEGPLVRRQEGADDVLDGKVGGILVFLELWLDTRCKSGIVIHGEAEVADEKLRVPRVGLVQQALNVDTHDPVEEFRFGAVCILNAESVATLNIDLVRDGGLLKVKGGIGR